MELDTDFKVIGGAGGLEYISGGGIIKAGSLLKNPVVGWIKNLINNGKTPKGMGILNPNALNKSLPGFTDKVPGSTLRQGRGPLVDYSTHKPALRPVNSQKLNKTGQWTAGVGLSGLSLYYFYKKMTQKSN